MEKGENKSRSLEVLGAYWRQGLHELGSVAYGPNTAAQFPEMGMLGTRPPSMVADGLRGDADPSRDADAESTLDRHLHAAKQRGEPGEGRDDRTMDRE